MALYHVRNHDFLQWYMILSTLSVSSHGFALGFPKRPRANGDNIPLPIILNNPPLEQSTL